MPKTERLGRESGARPRKIGPGAVAALLLFLTGAMLAAGGQAGEEKPKLPQAAAILDAYVEKAGGRTAFDAISNRRTVSKMTLAGFNAPAEVATIVTRAGAFRCVVDSPAFGKIEYGSDGKTVWEINPISGPQIKEGSENRRFRALYSLDLPMRWREAFKSVECTGLDAVDGKPAYKLMAVTPEDYAVTYYFDAATGLPAKIEYPVETATGRSKQEIFLSDHRSAAGLMFPFSQMRREAGREMTLAFTKVEYNVEIPEGTFALPEAIAKIRKAGVSEERPAAWRTAFTEMEVGVDPRGGRIAADARLRLESDGQGGGDIPLELNRELAVLSVTDGEGRPLAFDRSGGRLTIRREERAGPARTRIVRIRYEGSFTERVPELDLYNARIGADFAHALPPARWYPQLPAPDRRSKGRISFQVPADWTVAGVGKLRSETAAPPGGRFVFDVASPVQFGFAAAPFRALRRTVDGLDVGIFLIGGGPDKAEFYMRNCARIVRFLKDYYGFFPYESYAAVEFPLDVLGKAGGGSYEGLTAYIPGALPEGFFNPHIFGHEISHLWWGNYVRGAEGPVIDEGLTQLSTALILEDAFGENALRAILKDGAPELGLVHSARFYFHSLRAPAASAGTSLGLLLRGEDLELGIPSPEKRNTLHALANSKGAFVYVMLRDLIGGDAFRAGLRAALARFGWGTMSLADLRAEMEKASGRGLAWFFDQWFFRKGAPEFALSFASEPRGGAWEVRGRIRQLREPYRVSAEVAFVKGAVRETRIIEVHEADASFSFILPFEPSEVLFDPGYKILRWTDEFKSP